MITAFFKFYDYSFHSMEKAEYMSKGFIIR